MWLVPLLLVLAGAQAPERQSPFVERYLESAARQRAEGKLPEARLAVETALERDDRHLGALRLLAELALAMGDRDAAVYAYHRWLDVVDAAAKPLAPAAERKQVYEQLLVLDPAADQFRKLTDGYLKELMAIAGEHVKRKRFHSALTVYDEALIVDPLHAPARQGILDVRRKGSADVATEDVFAGGDPTFGVSPDWIAAEDAKHGTWETAWEKAGENYDYKTDAGFLVLQTASIAMEQMNGFYRQFFRYKLDGDPTPRISVLIYQNRDEYLKYNGLPANDWTGGFFNGSSVQTYVGGQTGRESIREMYGTLFHEAAHQFVSLTGKGGVPGWLNEAYASFFEGCTILSNGSVKWNQVANHRLFPLAERMDRGWMASVGEAAPDSEGNFKDPPGAPSFRMIVEDQYGWGPPWYAPTWGVVYFLYNYRDERGAPVFRDALHDYYHSNAGAFSGAAAVEHFEKTVLTAPGAPARTIDELNEVWRQWILHLREVQLGNVEEGKKSVDFGDEAKFRGELDLAVEFYEEAYEHFAEDPEVLWKLAAALEEQESLDRAAALYRDFSRELELRGLAAGDARYRVALAKMEELDPLFRRQKAARVKLLADGLALARGYRERQLPSMAMELARRMSAQFSLPEALELYVAVAKETGKSLARWRVAYNETDLEGWSSTGTGFRAYGKQIECAITADPSAPAGSFLTQELACDVTFDADFSLEAELRAEPGCNLIGLCFGRKDGNNTHAVVLHPKGFLDISSKVGGQWTVREHRETQLEKGWQKLRIDVVGDTLDVYLNGRFIRSMKMPSRDSVRGGFGLISGAGTSYYQNVRLLARDPHDPAARIERELAMQRIAENVATQREPGSFAGTTPPELVVHQWLQGEPLAAFAAAAGRPLVLAFWNPSQDKLIPTTAYYQHLAERYAPLGVRVLAVCNNQDTPEGVRAYLRDHPMPAVAVAYEAGNRSYENYNLKIGGFGLPRVLLLDVDGTVAWEGDPGLHIGTGWDPAAGATFVDGALEDLVERRRLRELEELGPRLEQARALAAQRQWRAALEALAPLADLEAVFDPRVAAARTLRLQIMDEGAKQLLRAVQHWEAQEPLRALAAAAAVAEGFPGTLPAEQAAERRRDWEKQPQARAAQKAWKALEKAAVQAERGRDATALAPLLDEAAAASTAADVADMVARLRAAAGARGAAGFLEVWKTLP